MIDGLFSVPSQTVNMSNVQQVATSSTGSVFRMNYGNNEAMSAIIAPTGAVSVVLRFTTLNTESSFDFVTVKSCTAIGCSQTSDLGRYSGTTIPSPVTSNTGIMLIQWTSDGSYTYAGWSATWGNSTYTGMPQCSATSCTPARLHELSIAFILRSKKNTPTWIAEFQTIA